MKIGVFILMRDPGKAIRNYYENRLFSFFIRGLGRPSAILTAVGIQSPFPHPTWFVSAGMFQLGRQPVHPARLRNYLKTPILASYPWMGEDQGDGERYRSLILTISPQRRRDF